MLSRKRLADKPNVHQTQAVQSRTIIEYNPQSTSCVTAVRPMKNHASPTRCVLTCATRRPPCAGGSLWKTSANTLRLPPQRAAKNAPQGANGRYRTGLHFLIAKALQNWKIHLDKWQFFVTLCTHRLHPPLRPRGDSLQFHTLQFLRTDFYGTHEFSFSFFFFFYFSRDVRKIGLTRVHVTHEFS